MREVERGRRRYSTGDDEDVARFGERVDRGGKTLHVERFDGAAKILDVKVKCLREGLILVEEALAFFKLLDFVEVGRQTCAHGGLEIRIAIVAEGLADREKIRIMKFDVIYELVEGVRKYMEKMLSPESVRMDLAKLKTLLVFLTEKNRQIVGGRILEGEIKKGVSVEVQRKDEIVGRGRLINLQRNKKDIEKAGKGEEVGLLYEGDVKIEQGDTLIFYTEERQKAEL